MGRIKSVKLNAEQKAALEKGFRHGHDGAFRLRCQMILLKSQGLSSARVSQELGCCAVSVNRWLVRYQEQGLSGLETQSGQGRKAILETTTDLEAVREVVANNRQRISVAKAELEQALGKSFCERTLRRFVKKTVVALNASENVPVASASRSFTRTKSNV